MSQMTMSYPLYNFEIAVNVESDHFYIPLKYDLFESK